jgi:uncharacterized membrane protein YqjE
MMHETSSEDASVVELVRRAAGDARELGRLEIALAKQELLADLAAAKSTAILAGSAVALALVGLSSLVVALGITLGPVVALVVGLALLASAAALAFGAYKSLPKPPMIETVRRLGMDEKILEEHIS